MHVLINALIKESPLHVFRYFGPKNLAPVCSPDFDLCFLSSGRLVLCLGTLSLHHNLKILANKLEAIVELTLFVSLLLLIILLMLFVIQGLKICFIYFTHFFFSCV